MKNRLPGPEQVWVLHQTLLPLLRILTRQMEPSEDVTDLYSTWRQAIRAQHF